MRDILFVDDVCRLIDIEIGRIGALRHGVQRGAEEAPIRFHSSRPRSLLEKRTGPDNVSVAREQNGLEGPTL